MEKQSYLLRVIKVVKQAKSECLTIEASEMRRGVAIKMFDGQGSRKQVRGDGQGKSISVEL